jgi:transcriptional regulator with XRE-family HTH domain
MFTIKQARGARYTQRGLAEKLGIDPGHLSRIESGERQLSPDLALRIARLTVSPAEVTAAKVALLRTQAAIVRKRREDLVTDLAKGRDVVAKAAAKAKPEPAFGTPQRSGSAVADVSPDSDVIALNQLLDVHGYKVAEDGNGNLSIFSATTGELIGRTFADIVQHMASDHSAAKSERDGLGRRRSVKQVERDGAGRARPSDDDDDLERDVRGRRMGRERDPGRNTIAQR